MGRILRWELLQLCQSLVNGLYQYFRLYQKDTPQICLILHQFDLYVLLICGKKIGDD